MLTIFSPIPSTSLATDSSLESCALFSKLTNGDCASGSQHLAQAVQKLRRTKKFNHFREERRAHQKDILISRNRGHYFFFSLPSNSLLKTPILKTNYDYKKNYEKGINDIREIQSILNLMSITMFILIFAHLLPTSNAFGEFGVSIDQLPIKSPEQGIQEINPILRHRYSSRFQERLKTLHDALSTITNKNRQLHHAKANATGRLFPPEYNDEGDSVATSMKNGSYRTARNCFFSPIQCQLPYSQQTHRVASLEDNVNDANSASSGQSTMPENTEKIITYQAELSKKRKAASIKLSEFSTQIKQNNNIKASDDAVNPIKRITRAEDSAIELDKFLQTSHIKPYTMERRKTKLKRYATNDQRLRHQWRLIFENQFFQRHYHTLELPIILMKTLKR